MNSAQPGVLHKRISTSARTINHGVTWEKSIVENSHQSRDRGLKYKQSSRKSLSQEHGDIVVLRDNAGSGRSFFQINSLELQVLANFANYSFRDDPLLTTHEPLIPVDGSSVESFSEAFSDGRLLISLINLAKPGLIDTRLMMSDLKVSAKSKKGQQMADSRRRKQSTADLSTALTACRKVPGVKIVNAGPLDFVDCKPTVVLGLVWQLVGASFLRKVSIELHPEIIRLTYPGENLALLYALPGQDILIRWVNWHLAQASQKFNMPVNKISNFTSHLRDCRVYNILLCQLEPSIKPSLDPHIRQRACKLVQNVKDMGVPHILTTGRDIDKCRGRMNEALLAQIFHFRSGLESLSDSELEILIQKAESHRFKDMKISLNKLKQTRAKLFDLPKSTPFPEGLDALKSTSSLVENFDSLVLSASSISTSSSVTNEKLPNLVMGGLFSNSPVHNNPDAKKNVEIDEPVQLLTINEQILKSVQSDFNSSCSVVNSSMRSSYSVNSSTRSISNTAKWSKKGENSDGEKSSLIDFLCAIPDMICCRYGGSP